METPLSNYLKVKKQSMTEVQPTLYLSENSSPCKKVLIALAEKNVSFIPISIDLIDKKEQYDSWFLAINPRGEVPVFVHGHNVVSSSNEILKYIDENFGYPNQLYPTLHLEKILEFIQLVNTLSTFLLTYGILFLADKGETAGITKVIRYPFNSMDLIRKKRELLEKRPEFLRKRSSELSEKNPSRKIIIEKVAKIEQSLSIFRSKELYSIRVLKKVEEVLDHIEHALSTGEVGPYLGGLAFTGADISLTALLFRLYQLGLDQLWKDGKRSHLSVYTNLVFERPSVLHVTQWKKYQKYELHLKDSQGLGSEEVAAAAVGLTGILAVAGIYIFKKFF